MSLWLISTRRRRGPAQLGGLAMSRGPTGSRWGLDARGPDGGIPNMIEPTYGTTAAASFTQYAQAADFYNSIGINTHPYYPGINFDSEAQRATAIDRIQELGIRYVRGLGLFSPSLKSDIGFQDKAQFWLIECMNANAARSTNSGGPDGLGEHPMFHNVGLDREREYWITQEPQTQMQYDLYDSDGAGSPFFRPLDGPPGQVGLTTEHWAGKYYARDKSLAGNPIGWSNIEMLTGPNEADNNRTTFFGPPPDGEDGIRWGAEQLVAIRDDPARADTVVLEGEDYIDYNTGRITPGPAYFPQLPVIPYCHFVGPEQGAPSLAGDYTDRQDGDFAAWHRYFNGHTPNWNKWWGTVSQNMWPQIRGDAFYGWMHGLNCVNGRLAPGGVRYNRSLPLIITESGLFMYPQNWTVYAPPDVGGEYTIQDALNAYCQGSKRWYQYKLSNEGGDAGGGIPAMGLCSTGLTRYASFYALKNMMALVGWKQGPDEGVQPMSIPHTFTPGPTTYGDDLSSGNPAEDMMIKLVLRQGADEAIVILTRPYNIWSRQMYAQRRNAGDSDAVAEAAARKLCTDVRNTVLYLPTGWSADGIAEPAKNNIKSPNDGQLYGGQVSPGDATDGRVYYPPGTTGIGFTTSGQQVTVRMGALTRIVKIVR